MPVYLQLFCALLAGVALGVLIGAIVTSGKRADAENDTNLLDFIEERNLSVSHIPGYGWGVLRKQPDTGALVVIATSKADSLRHSLTLAMLEEAGVKS